MSRKFQGQVPVPLSGLRYCLQVPLPCSKAVLVWYFFFQRVTGFHRRWTTGDVKSSLVLMCWQCTTVFALPPCRTFDFSSKSKKSRKMNSPVLLPNSDICKTNLMAKNLLNLKFAAFRFESQFCRTFLASVFS